MCIFPNFSDEELLFILFRECGQLSSSWLLDSQLFGCCTLWPKSWYIITIKSLTRPPDNVSYSVNKHLQKNRNSFCTTFTLDCTKIQVLIPSIVKKILLNFMKNIILSKWILLGIIYDSVTKKIWDLEYDDCVF